MSMTFAKNIKIKKYGVDFGIIAKGIVYDASRFMVELSEKGVTEQGLHDALLKKIAELIEEKTEEIGYEKLIAVGTILFDIEEEYDIDKEEDYEKIEMLLMEVKKFLVEKTEKETYTFIEMLSEKK